MTSTRDPERLFTAWMSEGPETLRDDVLAGVAVEVRRTAQHRGVPATGLGCPCWSGPWR